MTFLYPDFLWALFAIAIPIIIHLFNFRTHKIVYFSNVAFLDDIEQETKSRNRLKDLLILLMRILTIAALVLAFANPVILKNNTAKNNNCLNNFVIYVDNSFSMSALNNDGTDIDAAKTKAVDIVNSMKSNVKFLYLNNEFSPKLQHFYIKDITLQNITNTGLDANFLSTSFILNKISNIIKDESINCKPEIFYVSDFQKNTFDAQNIISDTAVNLFLLPVYPTQTDNVYIDTLWFESPYHLYNGADSLIVRITNNSENDLTNFAVKLFLNDTLKTLTSVNIKANSQQDIKLQYVNTQNGFIGGRIEIEDYHVTYDNSMFFSYYIAPQIKVLLLENKQNTYIEKFYDNNKYFDVQKYRINNFSISELSDYQVVVLVSVEDIATGLASQLYEYIEQGGVVVLIPSQKANTESLNNFLTKCEIPNFSALDTQNLFIDKINLNSKIYKNAFAEIKPNSIYPQINEHFKFAGTISNIEKLLTLENGDNYLIMRDLGLGAIYVFASDLNSATTDFMLNPVSVPTFYNASVLRKSSQEAYHIIGEKNSFDQKIYAKAEAVKLVHQASGMEFYPKILQTGQGLLKLQLPEVELKAGNYSIVNQDNKIGEISLNYNRKESNFEFYSQEELEKLIKKFDLKNCQIIDSKGIALQNDLQVKIEGKYLWKLFVVLSLIFILLEILIIRFFAKSK